MPTVGRRRQGLVLAAGFEPANLRLIRAALSAGLSYARTMCCMEPRASDDLAPPAWRAGMLPVTPTRRGIRPSIRTSTCRRLQPVPLPVGLGGHVADRAGFEPARRRAPDGLATRYLQPLGHRSAPNCRGTESGSRTRTELAPRQGLSLVRLPISPPRSAWRMLEGSNPRGTGSRASPVLETGALPLGQASGVQHMARSGGVEPPAGGVGDRRAAAARPCECRGQDGWVRATGLVLPTHARYLCATS